MIFSSTFYRLCYYSWQTALAPPTPGLAIDDGHLWTSLPVPPEGPQRWALLRSDLDPPQGSARGLFCRPTLHPDPKALWVLVTSLPADSSGRAFPSTLPLATSTLTATPVRTHLQPRPTTTTRPPSRRRAQQDQSCPTPAPHTPASSPSVTGSTSRAITPSVAHVQKLGLVNLRVACAYLTPSTTPALSTFRVSAQ